MVYGRQFNPLITLKALTFFEDVPALPMEMRALLSRAVQTVDIAKLPVLTPYAKRDNGIKP